MKTLLPWRTRNGGSLDMFRNEMENMVEQFFGAPLDFSEPRALQPWAPRVDVKETDKEFVVKADLPGVEPKDVEISVADGSLVLRGEKKEEREEKKDNYHRVERFLGKFYREIPLPPGADADKVAAVSAKGVITITIPKKPEVMPKKISVKAQD
jgi:HSP20 family protein